MLTVGEILRKAREKKELTLADVEKHTKVRQKFLRALENNDWTQFSSKIYINGIIKNYSTYLGLNPDHTLAFFRREYEKKEDSTGFKRRASKGLFFSEKRRSTVVGLVVILILFFSYFGFQLFRFLTPPSVTLMEPQEKIFKRVDKVQIVGRTEKEAVITIFGTRVFQNDKGKFTYDLPLKTGKNFLTIKVQGANGKTTILQREYVLAP